MQCCGQEEFGTWVHRVNTHPWPPKLSQMSIVQSSWSSQVTGSLAQVCVIRSQCSFVVHAFVSVQSSGLFGSLGLQQPTIPGFWQPCVGEQVSVVQGLPSVQSCGNPPTQVSFEQ